MIERGVSEALDIWYLWLHFAVLVMSRSAALICGYERLPIDHHLWDRWHFDAAFERHPRTDQELADRTFEVLRGALQGAPINVWVRAHVE